MLLVEVDAGSQHQADGQQVEGSAGNPQGTLLKLVPRFSSVGLDPAQHVPDTDCRDHLDKGVYAETEQRQGFISRTKPDRSGPFRNVIEDGKQRQPVCPL